VQHDLTGLRGSRHFATQHRALHLEARSCSLDDRELVVLKAGPSSSRASETFVIPTEEPIRAGLTKTGSPSGASAAKTCARSASKLARSTERESTCGTADTAISCLKRTLSMHRAELATPDPT
jgi:hypothetical protein